MTRYKETQTGWLLIIPASAMFLFITWLFSFQVGDRPISMGSYFLVMGILALMVLLMYRMQTEVSDDKVTIAFGIGIIRKVIATSSIQSVSEVTNPWYYGWGIRLIPKGWLYNMGGLKGVEIVLGSGRVVRIGSWRPGELAEAVNAVITKASTA